MKSLSDLWAMLFPSAKKAGAATPGNVKPHDLRNDETVDMTTGIATEDGQIVVNTSIDPKTQIEAAGFPVPDPEKPERK